MCQCQFEVRYIYLLPPKTNKLANVLLMMKSNGDNLLCSLLYMDYELLHGWRVTYYIVDTLLSFIWKAARFLISTVMGQVANNAL